MPELIQSQRTRSQRIRLVFFLVSFFFVFVIGCGVEMSQYDSGNMEEISMERSGIDNVLTRKEVPLGMISIWTSPIGLPSDIYLNGEWIGREYMTVQVPQGNYEISVGDLAVYTTPDPVDVPLSAGQSVNIEMRYTLDAPYQAPDITNAYYEIENGEYRLHFTMEGGICTNWYLDDLPHYGQTNSFTPESGVNNGVFSTWYEGIYWSDPPLYPNVVTIHASGPYGSDSEIVNIYPN